MDLSKFLTPSDEDETFAANAGEANQRIYDSVENLVEEPVLPVSGCFFNKLIIITHVMCQYRSINGPGILSIEKMGLLSIISHSYLV